MRSTKKKIEIEEKGATSSLSLGILMEKLKSCDSLFQLTLQDLYSLFQDAIIVCDCTQLHCNSNNNHNQKCWLKSNYNILSFCYIFDHIKIFNHLPQQLLVCSKEKPDI